MTSSKGWADPSRVFAPVDATGGAPAGRLTQAPAGLSRIRALLFDLDGVITRTATLHATAWKRLFDEVLSAEAGGATFKPFDIHVDYRTHVDGKPRVDGLRDFLHARGIRLPEGHAEDGEDVTSIAGLAKRKDRYFHEAVAREGVEVFSSSVELAELARREGLAVAVISSSKNMAEILEAAGLADLFPVRVDGREAERLQLSGKPSPDVFLQAARQLGVAPSEAAVIEDAVAGVEAGRRGGFGLVIGVDRTGNMEALQAAGADLVVSDLSELLPAGGPPLALSCINAIAGEIHGKKLAVFLDYDGTVSPIVDRPEDAVLPEPTRAVIEALSHLATVAFISGRRKEEVRGFVGLDNVIYAGSHGFTIEGPDGLDFIQEDGARIMPVIQAEAEQLRREIGDIDGVLIEDKSFAIAVHYRLVEEAHVGRVEAAVDAAVGRHEALRKSGGKKVFEIRPRIDWHKGKAVQYLLKTLHLDANDVVPLYIGDDVTDEDAFQAVRGRGIAVYVNEQPAPTAASFRVRNTDDVRVFLQALQTLLQERQRNEDWVFGYDAYDPQAQGLREALLAVGNGVFVTRGAFAEARAGDTHYPGTYAAGVFNRLVTPVSGHDIENEDLVNLPNWLPLDIRTVGCDWIDLDQMEILSFRHELDMRAGILSRDVRVRDAQGRVTRLQERRLLHMGEPNLAALEVTLTAEGWSGHVDVKSAIDGTVINAGVARYRALNSQHLQPVDEGVSDGDVLTLRTRTTQSGIEIAHAARTQVFHGISPVPLERRVDLSPGYASQSFGLFLNDGVSVRIEKTVALHTSKDWAISEPALAARQTLARAGHFDVLAHSHAHAWRRLWDDFDTRFTLTSDAPDGEALRVIRLHLFHLLQTCSPNTIERDAGAPARGLHGEAYRGHIFWDEIFIFPTLTYRQSAITRALMRYRHRRLPAARAAAHAAGYRGAMYPWQSGTDGREESQQIHLNPKSGRWVPDNSRIQRHVNVAIAYNIWTYYQITDDREFMLAYGAEMLLEIARFWASVAVFNPDRSKYEILGVMGPDEYHDGYPDREEPGLDNNAYTNLMVAWILARALDYIDALPAHDRSGLIDRLSLTPDELAQWDAVSRALYIPFHGEGVISQFEGYGDLAEFDWDGYRAKYGDIQRLDRILEAEDDTPNRYKASKQADVLMLFYLFSAEELKAVFARLGLSWDKELIPRNIDYYLRRTSHGSTLSRLVHAWVLARSDRTRSWGLFYETLMSDVTDIQGGTTREGIHLGAITGSVDLLHRCYGGIEVRDGVLHVDPCLPEGMDSLSFRLRVRGSRVDIHLTPDTVEISVSPSTPAQSFRFAVRGRVHDDLRERRVFFDAATGQKLPRPGASAALTQA